MVHCLVLGSCGCIMRSIVIINKFIFCSKESNLGVLFIEHWHGLFVGEFLHCMIDPQSFTFVLNFFFLLTVECFFVNGLL